LTEEQEDHYDLKSEVNYMYIHSFKTWRVYTQSINNIDNL